ncbi:MAG: TIM barrel protein [Nanobdellota archaeon]
MRFGTAGIPINTRKPSTENGIREVNRLGLECMELEFVYSVNVSQERAKEVKRLARENDVKLSAHGSYYINLNAKENHKIGASKKRISDAARRLDDCGGDNVVFHPGFYLKQDPEKVYENVRERLKELRKKLDDEGCKVMLRPETTGKRSQFGSLKELLRISEDTEGVMPCIDFSHLHARTSKMNSLEEFRDIFSEVEKHLGKEGLKNIHGHISGINYSEKGERNHLILQESDMNYKELLRTMKEFNCKGNVICESPNIEEDSLLMQKYYRSL